MSRIRTIKPEFWVDERLGECSTSARLLFIATWTFADDEGNLDRSSKQLKAQAFPYDSLDPEPLVRELLDHGLLTEYGLNGTKYLHINNFSKHQRIDRKSPPRFPLYDDSMTTRRVIGEDSRLNGVEGNIGEEEVLLSEPENGSDLVLTPPKNGEAKTDDFLPLVWDYYIATIGRHPKLTLLTEKRRAMFRSRMKECWPALSDPKAENAIEMCKYAIDKLSKSPHHNGQNAQNEKYLDWEIIFRTREQFEKWLNK